jgi:hypothetical protein
MCAYDSDCTDGGANGRCLASPGGPAGCYCTYDQCQRDTDCKAGELCVCHDSTRQWGGNTCMPGNCRIDSDCGPNGYCSPEYGWPQQCGYVIGYYCHTKNDLCTNDSDCASNKVCTWVGDAGAWECRSFGPLCT